MSRRLQTGIGLFLAAVLGLAAYGYHRSSLSSLLDLEERKNVAVAAAVVNSAAPSFAAVVAAPPGLSRAELRARPEVEALSAQLRATLNGVNVAKVSVRTPGGLTVFSTDPAQIGDDRRDDATFKRALRGEDASELLRKGSGASASDRDVVATHVLLREGAGTPPKAVVEIDSDVSELLAPMLQREWMAFATVIGAAALLYALSLVATRLAAESNRREEREAGERRVRHQAYHDAMTGLPNRANFLEHLAESANRAHRNGGKFAVFAMDIDRFKLINDSLGHKVGDRLLRRVARRMKSLLPKDERLFRIGGDEFGFVLSSDNPARDAADLAARLLGVAAGNFQINDRSIAVALSIGVTVYPDDAADSAALVRNVDAAMHSAKSAGGNRLAFFAREMSERAGRQLDLEAGLRRALKAGEFELYYQPRYDARDRRVIGAEALLRWHTNDGKFVSPDEFVPVLEDTGLVVPVGRWVLQQAAKQAQIWQMKGVGEVRVSVNVSPRQFHSEDFIESVRSALRVSGLPPRWLELELTERLLCEDTELAVAKMQALKRLGVALSIDDFGTGYSSLSYLQRFPIDFLKIDKSFVRGIAKGKREAAIALAIIDLAHNLQIGLVAEGVEQEDQAVILRDRGCMELQGFLFSRPLSARQAEHRIVVTNGRASPAAAQAAAERAIISAKASSAGVKTPAPFAPTEFAETTM